MTARFLIPLVLFHLAVPAANGRPSTQSASVPAPVGKVAIRFAPPAQRRPVPYDGASGHLIFRARVAGSDIWVLLDNKAGRSILDGALASRLGLAVTQSVGKARTPTGEVSVGRVDNVEIMVPGQLRTVAPAMAVMDLAAVSAGHKQRIEAVIGADYLGMLALQVDPRKGTVLLAPSGSLAPAPGASEVPLLNAQAEIELTAGNVPLRLPVDLGSSAAVGLDPRAWARAGSSIVAQSTALAMHADGQPYVTDRGVIRQASVGGLILENVPVRLRPPSAAMRDGILGMGFLSNYGFILDTRAGKLWLTPQGGD